MTVATETFWNVSTGNGVTSVFSFSFPVTAKTDVIVLLDGVVAAGNYVVTFTDADNPLGGGNVTFETNFEPASGVQVLRIRRLEYLQATSLPNQGAFNAQTVERAFDRGVMLMQQLKATALRVSDKRLADGFDGEITAVLAPGYSVVVNSDGDGFTLASTLTGATVSAAMGDVVEAATLAAARDALGVEIGADVQAYSSALATWAGIAPSANVQAIAGASNYASVRALLDLEAGTDFYSKSAADAAFQPIDAQLTAFAANTSVTGTITVSSAAASGGSNGDLWLKYTP